MSIASVIGYTRDYWGFVTMAYPQEWSILITYILPVLCLLVTLRVGVTLGRRGAIDKERENREQGDMITALREKIDVISMQMGKLTDLLTGGSGDARRHKAVDPSLQYFLDDGAINSQ